MQVDGVRIDHTETHYGTEYQDKTWGSPMFLEVENEALAIGYAKILDGTVKSRTVFVGEWK